MSNASIDNVVTSGTFSLDGGTWDVDNNVWIVGDDSEVVIIDAAHSAKPILDAVGDRTVKAIVLTHGHNDHITVAPELSKETGAPILLHPEPPPDVPPGTLDDGQEIEVAGTSLKIINTPGHSPGSSVIYAPELGVLFSGDTLFNGGPGATGRSFSSFPKIIESIKEKIFVLDPETKVYTGHGDGTTVGDEAPHLEEWIKRGS